MHLRNDKNSMPQGASKCERTIYYYKAGYYTVKCGLQYTHSFIYRVAQKGTTTELSFSHMESPLMRLDSFHQIWV